MAEYSFDIVADFNQQELINTLDQVRREITNRYDFKGSKTEIESDKEGLLITTESTMRLQAVITLVREKGYKRGLSPKLFDPQLEENAANSMVRQRINIRKELNQESAKLILKKIKDKFKKTKVSIQGEVVRVSDKSKDILQEIMTFLNAMEDFEFPLSFTNYR
ncbi:MAG: YajQ family cyclic di-GMP-binding protein [bacterium]